ncbi:hypothetical protein HPB50_029016 [Hyalomma asiaticum]|nr:hypothetical protein HPB50_029016 [Hyalomma asiaticum]
MWPQTPLSLLPGDAFFVFELPPLPQRLNVEDLLKDTSLAVFAADGLRSDRRRSKRHTCCLLSQLTALLSDGQPSKLRCLLTRLFLCQEDMVRRLRLRPWPRETVTSSGRKGGCKGIYPR